MESTQTPQPALPTQQVIALAGRSGIRGLAQLAGHLVLLGSTGTGIYLAQGGWWLAPAMLLHGIVQVALFAALHETVHRTVFRARLPNDAVARLVGLVHFLPADYFRRFHTAHHRFTQDPARDPELAGPKPTSLAGYLSYVSGFVYWRDRAAELLRHAAGRVTADFVPAFERRRIANEARAHLAIYGAIAAVAVASGWSAPLFFWVLPALLGQPFLRLYLLAEHTGCPECPDMLANSRTTRSNPLVRFLMWNMPYHVEHHGYPYVPFHALPALHSLLADRLRVTAPGYVAVHRAYLGALLAGRGDAYARPSVTSSK